ncbi:radical SAM/SPASM domain-containing protein [Candidatus Sulfurimonas baltica]|uniref:SPASM domain-containing protein n=1 Tax=Candidatus Sulfurimonas baltica TaxID=2740404 RepID=A0A7S7LYB0_9BACT|nr:SPASM domain-containing protein [Candidatus Sulfurimonas baltica]QOY53118.1 SPASM domain-containing protein [Candidatus Sulfurimonas baltica]
MSKSKMHKVYIELTSKCGLSCDFCPSSNRAVTNMDKSLFEKVNTQAKAFTDDIAYHVVGDPLLVENIREYLDISYKAGLNVHITTAGYYLKPLHVEVLNHPAIKQINFSLNSYRANNLPVSLEVYLTRIAEFTLGFRALNNKSFINYRLWNEGSDNSHKDYNNEVISIMFDKLGAKLLSTEDKTKKLRVISKVLFNFDSLFIWPSLEAPFVGDKGYCHGLSSQMAILSSGDVVPCCFDYEAKINLGNVKDESLTYILNKERSKFITNGFKNGDVVEELCHHCLYRTKFN